LLITEKTDPTAAGRLERTRRESFQGTGHQESARPECVEVIRKVAASEQL
jgi:hypothetical protein